jgi:hypothetical protein
MTLSSGLLKNKYTLIIVVGNNLESAFGLAIRGGIGGTIWCI